MLQEIPDMECSNSSNIDLSFKSTYRRRILNTFIRCRNQARDAGDEFDYFSIPSQFIHSNIDFAKIQFLDSTRENEKNHVRSPSPSDSDEYSWSSSETEYSPITEQQSEETGSQPTCFRWEFSTRKNYDSVFHSRPKSPVSLLTASIPEVQKKIFCHDWPPESTSSKLCQGEGTNVCLGIKQNPWRDDIRSSNHLKRSCKLDDVIESTKKVPRTTGTESSNDGAFMESHSDRSEYTLGKKAWPSNSIQAIETPNEGKGNLTSKFASNNYCLSNVTWAQSFPLHHQSPLTVAGSLQHQNVYTDRYFASSKITDFVHPISSQDNSNVMSSGSIQNFEHSPVIQNPSCKVDQVSSLPVSLTRN